MPANSPLSRRALLRGSAGAAALLALAACSDSSGEPAAAPSALPRTTGSPTPSPSPSPSPVAVDPASVKANEVGVVPVLMYHRIVSEVKGEYDRTPADFKAELQRLFSTGYVPVRTIDFVRGDFSSVPAGKSPCVLTFDDAYREHLILDGDGNLDPTCAMAVIRDTAAEFGLAPAGSFNINKNPFSLSDPAQITTALTLMDRLGYEVANHTYDHENLKKLDDAGVQKELVLLQRMVTDAVPGAMVRTLALPFGVSPREKALSNKGTFEGESYTNEGILLVGSNPSKSPFSAGFDPLAIPRIRSTSVTGIDMTSTYWLDALEAKPEKRYVSAGNPGSVTVPAAFADAVAPAYKGTLVTY